MKKAMKALTSLEPSQFDTKVSELKRSLYDLRVKKSIGQLEKPSKLRDLRRDIARIETMRRQKRAAAPPLVAPKTPVAPAAPKKKIAKAEKPVEKKAPVAKKTRKPAETAK